MLSSGEFMATFLKEICKVGREFNRSKRYLYLAYYR